MPISEVFDTLQAYFGNLYINDFVKFGRVYRVQTEAEAQYRSQPGDISKIYVRALGREGSSMIPLDTVVSTEYSSGPDPVTHFNGYNSALVLGAAAPGYSSGQALEALDRVAQEVIGASWILAVPDQPANIALGILTIGLALYSFFKPELGQTHDAKHRDITGMLLGGAGLFVIGALNGSLTSGTGLFVTIWLVRWFGLDYKQAVAYTLVLVGLFWNGSGALTLALQTDVKWSWLPVLIIASFVGGYLGAHWGRIKGNKLIKRAFEIITLLTGLSLILKVALSP